MNRNFLIAGAVVLGLVGLVSCAPSCSHRDVTVQPVVQQPAVIHHVAPIVPVVIPHAVVIHRTAPVYVQRTYVRPVTVQRTVTYSRPVTTTTRTYSRGR